MKRLAKAVLKRLRRMSAPMRRPFQRRLEAYLSRCLLPSGDLLCSETTMLMDQVVRELSRLRRQIESLQRTIDDLAPDRERLAIADEIEA